MLQCWNMLSWIPGLFYLYTGPGTIWANDLNFFMKHAPGAGLIARHVNDILTISDVQEEDNVCSVSPAPHRVLMRLLLCNDMNSTNYCLKLFVTKGW
jgi:hypothetical protein